jgi:hypothetical protein
VLLVVLLFFFVVIMSLELRNQETSLRKANCILRGTLIVCPRVNKHRSGKPMVPPEDRLQMVDELHIYVTSPLW